MENKALEISNLSVLIKERFLVKNVSFSVEKGECVAIVGEDGSGKTSLIKAITGSLPVSTGKIKLDGKDITENGVLQNLGIALDPPVFFKFQSVYQNIKYLSRFGEKTSKEQILSTLEKVSLKEKAKYKVFMLTYAEKKLMGLALAFLNQPKVLLLDEPLKNLSDKEVLLIKKHLLELQKQGVAVIISTKNNENLLDICDRFVFMQNREVTKIVKNEEYGNYLTKTPYCFVQVKYPNYCGKLIAEKFDTKVKILGKRVLFVGDSDLVSQVVRFLTQSRIAIYKAGFLSSQSEQILAELSPFYKKGEE